MNNLFVGPHTQHTNGRAFTLIEVLVAMSIFSVGVLGVLGAILLSTSVASRAQRLDDAVVLANMQLEQAICVPVDKLENKQGQESRYTYVISMETRPGGLMAAKITIQWLESGEVQEYSISKVFLPATVQEEDK